MVFTRNKNLVLGAVLAIFLFGVAGCGESSAPVSESEKREMSSTPWGLFAGTGRSEGMQVQFDAGNEMTFTDTTGTKSGTYKMDEAKREITVDLNGQQQIWSYKRDGLSLEITFQDGRTGTFSMQ